MVERRGVPEDAPDRDDPPVALLVDDHATTRVGDGRADGRAGGPVRVAAVGAGGVGEADLHLLDLRCRVAERLEPLRATAPPAAGIDHQVRVEDLVRAAVVRPPQDAEAGHAAAVGGRGQPRGVATVEEGHVRQRQHPRPHARLEQRPADAQPDKPRVRPVHLPAAVDPAELRLEVDAAGAEADELLGEAREEVLEDLAAPGEQAVGVPALRYPAPRARGVVQDVTLDDRDAVEDLAEHARGHQPTHAGSDDDGVTGPCWHWFLPRFPGGVRATAAGYWRDDDRVRAPAERSGSCAR